MTFGPGFVEELRSLLALRRDVRHFTAQPVDATLLSALVEEAAHSPSVGFSQPWRFVKIQSGERREAVIASFEQANERALYAYEGERAQRYAGLKLAGLRDAPVHLAVFCDEATQTGAGLGAQTMPEMRRYSCAMAIYTFWLLARAHGIGVGWVSILDPDEVTRALDVPADWTLVAYLCVGYPETYETKPELERRGWEKRDDRSTQLYER